MRIVSWNVNGIRAAEKQGFSRWVREDSPDVLCLQETKAEPGQLTEELRRLKDGKGAVYYDYWASAKKKGYSGTAIFSKTEPLSVKPLGIAAFDDEGRVLQADYGDFTLVCAYFPNSQDAGARLPYKLDFCAAMRERCDNLIARGRHIVLCGDYNIAHTAIDLARPKENEGNAGYLPEERAWMDSFTAAGYADTFREAHPGERDLYSWWSYRSNARARNVGWRLDYHCVDRAFLPRTKNPRIRSEVHGADHCPVEIEVIRDLP
jgi:exodeoxyribonuclease-3